MNLSYEAEITERSRRFCDSLATAFLLGEEYLLPDSDKDYIELALDVGLAEAYTEKGAVKCRLAEKFAAIQLDLTEEDLLLNVTTLSGKLISTRYAPHDGSYYFDENLSFFIKDSALFLKKYMPDTSFVGVSVLLPELKEHYRGTKGILSRPERIASMVKCAFGTDQVISTSKRLAKDSLLLCTSISGDRILLLSREKNCYSAAFPGVCRSFGSIEANGDTPEDLAVALYNTLSIVKPKRIVFDRHLFTEQEDALHRFDVANEAMLSCSKPEITVAPLDFAVLGGTGRIRQKYCAQSLKKFISSEKGKRLWNFTR